MKFRLLRPLDGYVLSEFLKILTATALGFPFLVIVIDITESLQKYLIRHVPVMDIAKAYVFGVPETMFQVLPAAVLFATVFSIGGFTRHSEISAAKASGISFYRFIAPITWGAAIATVLGLLVGAAMPGANARRDELLQEKRSGQSVTRSNFTFATAENRIYKIASADANTGTLDRVEIDRKGVWPDYPSYLIYARTAKWARRTGWTLKAGVMHVMTGDSTNLTVTFDSLRDRHLTEPPKNLLANQKAPDEMGYVDLGNFIESMERSGTDVNQLRVERMLKIAIPATCMIIMLFGAPLATSNQRGGAAYGVGVSLGTTVIFLMLVQLTQAVGGKGLVNPELAAWLPGILFLIVGGALLARVRT
ncbi:MAG TPA: LptF/LptG family permease [Gemmatimonadaceae bacterium]|jgi:lipopolysaccharide export system permease protein|nr:LptF/LptG family permease [Gemmatimonadaceae bacterium]